MPTVLGAIGTPGTATGPVASVEMTTDTPVAAGQRAVFGVVWYGAEGVSLSVGGATDKEANPHADPNRRAALVSVPGPIASGTTVTATVPDGSFSLGLCGIVVEDMPASGYVDATGQGFGGDGNWTAPLTPSDGEHVLIVAVAWVDFTNDDQAPLSGYTEAADFDNVGNTTSIAMVYQDVPAASGAYSPGATCDGGNANVAASVAYLHGAAAAGGGIQVRRDGAWVAATRRTRTGDAWV